MVSLEDTGTGINAQDIQYLQPAFHNEIEWHGHGLSICRSITEAQGGKLWVEPNMGGGATFHFTLTTEPSPPPFRRLKLGPFLRASQTRASRQTVG